MNSANPELSSVHETLRAIRKALHMTQVQLQTEGLSAGYVAVIEQGKFAPSDAIFREILEALGITSEEFELIRANPSYLSVFQMLPVAEAHARAGRTSQAAQLVKEHSKDGRNFIRFMVLEAEVDVLTGSFISAEVTLNHVFAQMRKHSHLGLFERAMSAYGRLSSTQGSPLKATILLSEFSEAYKDRLSPSSQALICAMLIARLSRIEDFATADKVLQDFEAKNLELDLLSRGRMMWGKSNLYTDQGNFELALVYIHKALEIYNQLDLVVGQEILRGNLAITAAFDDSLTQEQRLSELDRINTYLSNATSEAFDQVADVYVMSRALNLEKLGRFEEALAVTSTFPEVCSATEVVAVNKMIAAKCLVRTGEIEKGLSLLDEVASDLQVIDLQLHYQTELNKCIDLALELGEPQLALNLKLSQDRQIILPIEGLF